MSPMYWPTVLLMSAIFLLVLELFVPSAGVLGVLSGLGFAAAIILAFLNGGLRMGTLYTGATALIVPVAINAALKLWPKTGIGKRMLIQPSPADESIPAGHRERQQWIGRRGVALTALLPSGAIRIDQRTVDAISDGTPIEKGTEVEVVAVRGFHLIVRPRLFSEIDGLTDAMSDGETKPLDLTVPDPFDDSLS